MDAPKGYNIPTGIAKYNIVRDYAGYSETMKFIIKYGGTALKIILGILTLGTVSSLLTGLLELLKSGIP